MNSAIERYERWRGHRGWVSASIIGFLVAGSLVSGRQSSGHIEGVVRLAAGAKLEAITIDNGTDPEACGSRQVLGEPSRTIGADSAARELAHVIVAVTNPPTRIPTSAPSRVTIDNRDCRFVPHVSVARIGSELVATNSDTVLHTTHLYGPREMNLSLPTRDVRATRRLTVPGLYAVKCDIHGWMQAYVRVDNHSWHATTDTTGAFRIENLPGGRFELEFWHPRLGSVRQEVQVTAGETARFEIDFPGEESQ